MKHGTPIALGVAFVVIGLAGCGTVGPVIPPDLDTYEGLVNALVDEQVILYDVRTPGEYEAGYIPQAINVPHTEIAVALPPDQKNQVIVVYCASGRRSAAAKEALEEAGFSYVYDFGSLDNWQGAIITAANLQAAEDCGCPDVE